MDRHPGLYLHGLGHAHPDAEITNAFLESLEIGTDDAWIRARTGIRSRRTVLPLDYIRVTRNREPRAALEAATESNAALARRAADMALARAGIDRKEVGMVLSGSSAGDTTTPAEACNVARALDLDVPALDVGSACTSFFAHLHLLAGMRPEALPDYVLLAVPETLTKTVDYTDRATAVLWGDAAVAAVVSLRHRGRARVLATELCSAPAGADKVVVPRGGHFAQQGQAVQAFAIRKTAAGLERLRRAHELEESDAQGGSEARGGHDEPGRHEQRDEGQGSNGCDARRDRELHFVGHQANLRMLEAVCRQCHVPPDRHHANLEGYGNTGAAGAPSVLSMRWEKWRATDDVAVAGVGAGLTWSSFLLRFRPAAA